MPLASIPELTTLATTALRRAGASEGMARAAAEALVHAEACGVPTHGLARLSLYCGHLRAGRVNGSAVPHTVRSRDGCCLIDAGGGLAYEALALASAEAVARAQRFGIAFAGVTGSHHAGAMAYHLRARHWLDALTPDLAAHVGRLADQLRGILARDDAPTPTIPPQPIPADLKGLRRPRPPGARHPRLVKVALDRPYTFIVMALMILIFGPLAAVRTPTDIFPNIGIPVLGVAFSYSGLSPDEVGSRLLAGYERFLSTTVNDVEHIDIAGFKCADAAGGLGNDGDLDLVQVRTPAVPAVEGYQFETAAQICRFGN